MLIYQQTLVLFLKVHLKISFLNQSIYLNYFFKFIGKGGQEIADLIISTLTTSYSRCFNFEELCVLKNKFTWTVNVDILILEVGSKASLFDSCAIAVKVALLNTR